ncbi:MAG TPA: 16S rRNA (adenine(1518)-N(6)/adenine(1519)-N(6))-dimethyltransferase RsmA [Vicinamibacterales bacterium]|nr:16S rRNA (adenine(1518)-N(6)/adenine(1519)-N(6))-dimethyltransferase RsmA [Vicinamibacterales bacterium]
MTAVELLGAARVRELLNAHGIRPKQTLGQNFVIDPNTIRKILAAGDVSPDERVLEIGPGVGSLTLALAGAAAWVDAVEIDRRLLPVLDEVLADAENVAVHNGDALMTNLAAFDASTVVANLPYNIAATVVLRVLESAPNIAKVVVMTQREVGERLAATPGSKTYGLTSVLVGLRGRARTVAAVSRRAFYPVPDVDSVIVRFDRDERFAPGIAAKVPAIARAAFGQRRKTLRNSLADLMGNVGAAEAVLERAGINPRARPEELHVEGFVKIAGGMQ